MPAWFGSKKKEPLHAARIEDYALIGDLETGALVSREGSIDWLCWPTFASPAVFAALLGTAGNGYWKLFPDEEVIETRRRYRPSTMILETTYVTRGGEILLIDFMPPRGEHSDIIRIVRGIRGKVKMRMDLVIRFDYGRTIPWVTATEDALRAVAGPYQVTLRHHCEKGSRAKFRGEGMTTIADFKLSAEEELCFVLTSSNSVDETVPPPVPVQAALADTERFWCDWDARSTYRGEYAEAVTRSLVTLEALTYKPTGGIVAAPTAGLPELIGGNRNWDYRYCWLRDTAFTLLVLIRAGYTEEAIRWRRWLLRAVAGAPAQIQAVYGIDGERQMTEWNATWLRGYEDSQPVRLGNAASDQFQLDVFGEVATALHHTPEAEDDIRESSAALQTQLIDHLCHVWDQPDEGIWETRGGRKHFVHSKVMAWVGLDRAIRGYERYDGGGDIKRWKKNRAMLRKEILKKGFNKKLNSFTQSYGSKTLDASLLRLGLVGFLPMSDPRIIGTVEAIEKQLCEDGFVLRYNTTKSTDGLKGKEGVFLACSFWMVSCLHLMGRAEDARAMFERLLSLRNDVGLLSEEYDPVACRMLGNFPQALSHIALAHAAFTLSGQWKPEYFPEEEE